MGPANATLRCLSRPLDFSGRTNRTEWWGFALGLLTVGLTGWLALAGLTGGRLSDAAPMILAQLPAGLPVDPQTLTLGAMALIGWTGLALLASVVRRLNDAGRSGWWVLAALVPVIGVTWLLLLTALRSAPGVQGFDAIAAAPAIARPSMPRRPAARRTAKTKRPARDRREIVSLYESRIPTMPRRPIAMTA